MEFKYLVMVNANANNNKFYRMIPEGNSFRVEYGRVGNTSFQKRTYPSHSFHDKYNEKLRKGYTDQTHLYVDCISTATVSDTKDGETTYKEISDVSVRKLVNQLMNFANAHIRNNYTISSMDVTENMVDEAQKLINLLPYISSVGDFNNRLIEIFTVIPRKMRKVEEHLAVTVSDFPEIIEKEQDLLDIMKTQVVTAQKEKKEDQKSEKKSEKTILDAMGISIKPVTAKEDAYIRKYLGRTLQGNYVQAFRVENKKTRKKFRDYHKEIGKEKEIKQLWHGSRNENWWNIFNTGLVLRPNAAITGKMFGYGIYFANRAAKSAGYISTYGSRWAGGNSRTGYLAIFDVLYGDPYIFDKNWRSEFSSLNYEKLQSLKKGADSFHAIGGKGTSLQNDEIIVYKEEQVTIKYIVEISS